MRGVFTGCAGLFLLAFLTGCQTPNPLAGSPLWTPSDSVTRAEAMSIADAYAKHRWKATNTNVFHGKDQQGVSVDTPDAGYKPKQSFAGWWKSGEWNTGVPYKWGGFDTPAEFDACMKSCMYAGDVFTPQKREMNNSAVSQHTAGVDCSGFISRCWRLSAPFSTYEIHQLCETLPDFESLRPGDVVNKENEHILLFVGWTDSEHTLMDVYDVGCPPNWKVAKHNTYTAWLKKYGYKPLRYNGMNN